MVSVEFNRKDFLSARGSVLVGPGFDPSGFDPRFRVILFRLLVFSCFGVSCCRMFVFSCVRVFVFSCSRVLVFSCFRVQNEPKLPPTLAHLGPKLAQVGPSRPKWCSSLRKSAHLKPPEALWAGSWGLLGPSWALLGRSWRLLGGSWGALGGSESGFCRKADLCRQYSVFHGFWGSGVALGPAEVALGWLWGRPEWVLGGFWAQSYSRIVVLSEAAIVQ